MEKRYYKCEECKFKCITASIGYIDAYMCYIDKNDNDANWQPITKEEFLKETEG